MAAEAVLCCVPSQRTDGLDAERMQRRLRGRVEDGGDVLCVRQVLLVGDHQHRQAVELLVVHHVLERRLGFVQPLGVARVDHVDDGVGVGEVALPDGAQALLAAEVPERDLAVPRLHAAD